MQQSTPDRAALSALLVMVVIWAYSWIVMKQAMRHAGPFDFVALRFLVGTGVLFLVLLALRAPLKPPPLVPTMVVGLSQTAAFQALTQWAVVSGGAGRVSLVAYTMPFWAILFAWLILAEHPGRRQWAGIACAVAGLVFIIEPWRGLGNWHSTALALVGGGCWGLGTVATKRIFLRYHASPLALTAWQMLFGTLALIPLALLVPSRPIDWSPAFVYQLLYVAVFASSLAWLLWAFIIDRLSATVASLSSLCVPITVILMAWAILHERPDAPEVAGIALIVLGLLINTGIGPHRRRHATVALPPAPGAHAKRHG